ncbi:MAG TPA: aromatic ring-hydroxylating dioxygenase subunit alpha [Rubrivivax sp.]|nr:aromatic ring-hydroxylating dioxygenase subunit alpha [Rubrivivax sp.]
MKNDAGDGGGAEFLLNGWYVLAQSAEVSSRPLSRKVCGQPVVMYRTASGTAVAMRDRCPHRYVPLSLGTVVGDAIQCAYHGIRFDCSGKCLSIPGDQRTPEMFPPQFNVPVYPVHERYGFVWAWLGSQALAADEPLPPFTEYLEMDGWEPLQGYQHTKADVSLIIDNLLDLSHEAFLHPNTIGNAAVGESPATTKVQERCIEVERLMPNCPPPAMFKDTAGFSGNIDRYQKVVFTPPSSFVIVVRATPVAGSAGKDLAWYVHHLLTPEANGSTHYFYALTRNFALGDAKVTEMLRQGSARTLGEDHAMLEAQQVALASISLDSRPLHTAFDGAPMAGRRLIKKLKGQEAAQRAAVAG